MGLFRIRRGRLGAFPDAEDAEDKPTCTAAELREAGRVDEAHSDGGFAQDFWVNGEPYWSGIQLDEVAFPIMLASRLWREKGLGNFDPSFMIRAGVAYLIRNGPVTQQERWEEASGYSPSTLAAMIAALVSAAKILGEKEDEATATFTEEYADYLESPLEEWTVTKDGDLHPEKKPYYIPILPEDVGAAQPGENPAARILAIKNIPPGEPSEFPAKNVVDGGFLELVRYGIRPANDPIIVATVEVLDEVLKVDTPFGPVWHRYNHDGYGQMADGGPFTQYGKGSAWPLLAGERGHYELAMGKSAAEYVRHARTRRVGDRSLPEQVWDEEDRPKSYMFLGKPTGSAMPLAWAHAEYIKLLRSVSDGKVYDSIPELRARYETGRKDRTRFAIWKLTRQIRFVERGAILRIIGPERFRLRWSSDGWQSQTDTTATIALDIHYVDIPPATTASKTCASSLRFTGAAAIAGRARTSS